MTPFVRRSGPSAALASLLQWVRIGQVVVVATGVIAVVAGLLMVSRGRRIEGVMMGVAGVAASVVAQVVIGYVAWRALAGVRPDAPGPPTGTESGRSADPGYEPVDGT